MKYTHKEGVEKKRSLTWIAIPIVGLVSGAYFMLNVYAPAVLYVIQPTDTTAKKLTSQQPNLYEDRVYIPRINTDVAVVPVEGNESLALERGAIQRSTNSGDPKNGGNFVLAAHRFSLGYTPQQTRAKSPFYFMGKLQNNDDIYVDYDGVRYAYRVAERKMVPMNAIDIEAPTTDDRLTLYSNELTGSKSEREVVVAKPVGKVVWTSGQPKLKNF